jgi:hypothetical protein
VSERVGEPLSPEESLRWAYRTLDLLYGRDLEGAERVTGGICDDCKKRPPRLRYGRFELCWACARRRRRAARLAGNRERRNDG